MTVPGVAAAMATAAVAALAAALAAAVAAAIAAANLAANALFLSSLPSRTHPHDTDSRPFTIPEFQKMTPCERI